MAGEMLFLNNEATFGLGALAGLIAGFFIVFLMLMMILYIYMSITLMTVAKKAKEKNPWIAWIPVGNFVLMSRIAKMHWWPVLLLIPFFIPFVNMICFAVLYVFTIIWTWKICEKMNRPGWWAVLSIIPIIGFFWSLIMWGILAWGEK